MTQIMNTTEMTDGQIENAVSKLRDAMRKHRSEIALDVAQRVLGLENLGMMMFTPFRERAEAVSKFIIRKVRVNRERSPQEALVATDRPQHTNNGVVDAMPRGEACEVEVVFFKLDFHQYNHFISDDDLDKEYELRGLKPADPISVAAVNEADPAFADDRPNGTHWKDAEGKWCYVVFDCSAGERWVCANRCDGWSDHGWFAGICK